MKRKTHKGAKKRFRVTGTGKLMRHHSKMRHILTKKSSRLKRHLRKATTVSASDARRVRAMLNL